MLEQSLRDIEAGRIVPMEPVLERMRAVAERIRRGQDLDAAASSKPA